MRRYIVASLLAAAVFLPQAAFSQDKPATEVEGEAEQEVEREPNFGLLDFDFLVAAGFGAFLYPHVEPGVEVGVVPIGDDMVISIGGGVDFGWCALCGLIDLTSDLEVKSSYWGPRFHGNLHLGTLFGLLDREMDKYTLDPYIGLWGGPTIYRFELTTPQGQRFETTQVTAIVGPAAGIRLGMADNTFLLFGEYRWGSEVGFSTVNVEDDGGTTYSATDEISGRGNDFILGVGLRI